MDCRIILTTTQDINNAKQIAHGLVQNNLAACTNIIQKAVSVYRWKDSIIEDEECILIIKTRKNLFENVKNFIIENHTYELPEVVMLPIEAGFEDYLFWIKENTLS